MPARSTFIPEGAWPRGLSADEAAAYVGLSRNTFLRQVEEGLWPDPIKIGKRTSRHREIAGRVIWDRHRLDLALDQLSGLKKPTGSSLDAEFDLASSFD
jgi:hypothetical protein